MTKKMPTKEMVDTPWGFGEIKRTAAGWAIEFKGDEDGRDALMWLLSTDRDERVSCSADIKAICWPAVT